jgi:hypothetical protein
MMWMNLYMNTTCLSYTLPIIIFGKFINNWSYLIFIFVTGLKILTINGVPG